MFDKIALPDDQAFIYKRNEDGGIDNTTLIGYGGAKRDNVIIPDSVTIIDDEAFYVNQLKSVTIPNSVTSIGSFAFYDNNFPNADAIKIEGDATRFDSNWTDIGFPVK